MLLWRISNYATLDGMGGTLQSAHWHTAGKPIVYAADHPSTCLLEMFVNVNASLLPTRIQLLKILVPDDLQSAATKIPDDWRNDTMISRGIGDAWLEKTGSVLLQVPSAILPDVYNTLINPLHHDAKRLKIMSVQAVPLDQRLS